MSFYNLKYSKKQEIGMLVKPSTSEAILYLKSIIREANGECGDMSIDYLPLSISDKEKIPKP